MQRLTEMHYFGYTEFSRMAARYGFQVRDLREDLLRAGSLASPKRTRRSIRSALRMFGLELPAYRMQRDFYVGMFELGMLKHDQVTK